MGSGANAYYGEVARGYEEARATQGTWKRERDAVREFLDIASDASSVLDLPCGTGRWLPDLPARATYTGVDISADMIAEANERTGKRQAEFQVADVFSWRPERTWDLLICSRFLNFFTIRDVGTILARLLPCSTRFAIITVRIDQRHLLSYRGRLRTWGREALNKIRRKPELTRAHPRSKLERIIAGCGFSIERTTVVGTSRNSTKECWLLKATTRQ